MTKIKATHTPCKDCVFAEYDEVTQTDCSLRKIDLFESKGTEVLRVYDDSQEFFVINGRRCPWKRDRNWIHANNNLDAQLEELVDETRVRLHVNIFADEDMDAVVETIDSLASQEVLPDHVTVIVPFGSTLDRAHLAIILKSYSWGWRVQNHTVAKNEQQALREVMRFVKFPYRAKIDAGVRVPEGYTKALNHFVVDNLGMFSAIGDPSFYVIPDSVYEFWHFKGDPKKTIFQIIQEHECQIDKKTMLTHDQLLSLV